MIKIKNYEIHAEQIDYSAWVWVKGINNKTKKETESLKLIGYYSSVYKCVEAIRNYEVHKSVGENLTSLDGAISIIRELDESFIKECKGFIEQEVKK